MRVKQWKINPDLIPQKDFHKGYWLNIDEPNPWYYFFPAQRSFRLPASRDFYKTVDKDLIKSVKLLHSKGIPTTPSCSGHFYGPDHYLEVYEKLLTNAKDIIDEGVVLRDSETGTKYFYRNPAFQLPWDHNSFIERSLVYQVTGVLGFVDLEKALYKLLRPDFEVDYDNGITLVFERSDNEEEKNLRWNELYQTLGDYLLS
jgi:hypothetical protein